ncbi:MAG: hypothetical protein ACRDOE_02660 [Streptosporangiaceae bacterium]
MDIDSDTLDTILAALADQLRAMGERQEIVVIGGSALMALGLASGIQRAW